MSIIPVKDDSVKPVAHGEVILGSSPNAAVLAVPPTTALDIAPRSAIVFDCCAVTVSSAAVHKGDVAHCVLWSGASGRALSAREVVDPNAEVSDLDVAR